MQWEKTIEYLFIGRLVSGKADFFAAPLSGRHERGAGDAIASMGNSLFLIEFKSCIEGLSSDEEKFNDYKKAKESLKSGDSHHLFVYGNWADDRLNLEATTYFSRNRHDLVLTKGGVDKAYFEKYLAQLLFFRKKDGRSGDGIGVSDYASVIGITSHGKFAGSVSLATYVAEAFPEVFHAASLIPEPQDEPTPRKRRSYGS